MGTTEEGVAGVGVFIKSLATDDALLSKFAEDPNKCIAEAELSATTESLLKVADPNLLIAAAHLQKENASGIKTVVIVKNRKAAAIVRGKSR